MTFKTFLAEGMIKLPEQFLKKLEDEVVKVALSVIKNNFESSLEDTALEPPAVKLAKDVFQAWIKQYDVKVPKMQLRIEKHVKTGDLKPEDVPQQYRKLLDRPAVFTDWELTGTPMVLTLTLAKLPDRAVGSYEAKKNNMKISMSAFKHVEFSTYFRTIQRAEESTNPNQKQHMLKLANEVLSRFGDMITRVKGILEHELSHYMQFKVLSRGHVQQIHDAGKRVSADQKEGDDEEYYTSQVEFDPQIKTAISDYKTLERKMLKKYPDQRTRPLRDWMTATGTRTAALYGIDRHDDWLIPDEPFEFFKKLKQLDNGKWKRAVKYFMGHL